MWTSPQLKISYTTAHGGSHRVWTRPAPCMPMRTSVSAIRATCPAIGGRPFQSKLTISTSTPGTRRRSTPERANGLSCRRIPQAARGQDLDPTTPVVDPRSVLVEPFQERLGAAHGLRPTLGEQHLHQGQLRHVGHGHRQDRLGIGHLVGLTSRS